jgi:hypothetical protein
MFYVGSVLQGRVQVIANARTYEEPHLVEGHGEWMSCDQDHCNEVAEYS